MKMKIEIELVKKRANETRSWHWSRARARARGGKWGVAKEDVWVGQKTRQPDQVQDSAQTPPRHDRNIGLRAKLVEEVRCGHMWRAVTGSVARVVGRRRLLFLDGRGANENC